MLIAPIKLIFKQTKIYAEVFSNIGDQARTLDLPLCWKSIEEDIKKIPFWYGVAQESFWKEDAISILELTFVYTKEFKLYLQRPDPTPLKAAEQFAARIKGIKMKVHYGGRSEDAMPEADERDFTFTVSLNLYWQDFQDHVPTLWQAIREDWDKAIELDHAEVQLVLFKEFEEATATIPRPALSLLDDEAPLPDLPMETLERVSEDVNAYTYAPADLLSKRNVPLVGPALRLRQLKLIRDGRATSKQVNHESDSDPDPADPDTARHSPVGHPTGHLP